MYRNLSVIALGCGLCFLIFGRGYFRLEDFFRCGLGRNGFLFCHHKTPSSIFIAILLKFIHKHKPGQSLSQFFRGVMGYGTFKFAFKSDYIFSFGY